MNGLAQTFMIVIALCTPAFGASKGAPLPDPVISAKTIYLVNQAGNDAVLQAATDEFVNWGRFTITPTKDEADLVIVFSHSNGNGQMGQRGRYQDGSFCESQ